jgi:hypothetical protein
MRIEGRPQQTPQLQPSQAIAEAGKALQSQDVAGPALGKIDTTAGRDQFSTARNAAADSARSTSPLLVPDSLRRSERPGGREPAVGQKAGPSDLVQVYPTMVNDPPKKDVRDLVQVCPTTIHDPPKKEPLGFDQKMYGGKSAGSETEIKVPEPERKPDTSPWGKQPIQEPKKPSMWDSSLD